MSVTSEDIDPRNLVKGTFVAFRASQWPAWAKKTYKRNWQTSVCWGVVSAYVASKKYVFEVVLSIAFNVLCL